MKGSKVSPSKNPNSYPMTDTKKFESKIQVLIDEKVKMQLNLEDDPADHRGVLPGTNRKDQKLLNHQNLMRLDPTDTLLKFLFL